jgi:putative methyltransferase (TIGR04325 family)
MVKKTIWSGIYCTFPRLGAKASPAFEGERWLERQVSAAEQVLEAAPAKRAEADNDSYFQGLIAGFLSGKRRPVKVVDFGGSLALAYLQLLKSYKRADRVQWTVIETKAICAAGRNFAKQHRLGHAEFVTDIGRLRKFDVFFARNAFHYTRDWRGLIKSIAQRGAELVVLRGVIAGTTPTFCTLQNYYGQSIPVWFFNEAELVQCFSKAGFDLVSRRPTKQRYFGKLQSPPMTNFPRSHRGKVNLDLVFALN